MCIARCAQVQRALEGDLPASAFEEIRPAYDVSDALQGIIHDHGELVGEHPVPAPHDHVAQLAHGKRSRSLETVFEGDGLRLVDPEAYRQIAGPSGSPTAGARIARIFRAQLAARTAAPERAARLPQRLQHLGIKTRPTALVFDLAIPQKAEGFEGAEDLIGAAGNHAGAVEILHAYEPPPAAATRVDEAADGGQ